MTFWKTLKKQNRLIKFIYLIFSHRIVYFIYKLMDDIKIYQIYHNLITYFTTLTFPKKCQLGFIFRIKCSIRYKWYMQHLSDSLWKLSDVIWGPMTLHNLKCVRRRRCRDLWPLQRRFLFICTMQAVRKINMIFDLYNMNGESKLIWFNLENRNRPPCFCTRPSHS